MSEKTQIRILVDTFLDYVSTVEVFEDIHIVLFCMVVMFIVFRIRGSVRYIDTALTESEKED